ncbi:uncharacterized protein LOC123021774 isoform X2 [Varanus komodoensis]|uniref:uncharacterized protein LOC123021774 isoform X2 n=1 Tax=Varanus komodoensis TaxID=61221 RepID=UPI001CF7B36C|nr:uncharacterized protein LOC123021774 isoform X2 [Varanus komodoensis]
MIAVLLVSILGALDAPKLITEPKYPEYFEGERVKFTCTAPGKQMVVGYRFFKQDVQEVCKVLADYSQKGRWSFEASINSTGNYSCSYWMGKAGAEAVSARSNPCSLRVTDAPAAPSLSLSPQQSDYRLGESVSLVCSAPPEKRVQEFKYSNELMTTSALVSGSSKYMLNMSILEAKHVGHFRCAYVVQLSGRDAISKQSNAVFIDGTGFRWARMLAVGGSFFIINGLIFLIFHFL